MARQILRGYVSPGHDDARKWGIAEIRKATGYTSLIEGTLNVRLSIPHSVRTDFRLRKEDRTDGRAEDLDFERCLLVTRSGSVAALIARTSTNAWGNDVLEIMAEVHLRSCFNLSDTDDVSIHVWIGADAAKQAQNECGPIATDENFHKS
jgi:CTP-dependent riboflavin kinase